MNNKKKIKIKNIAVLIENIEYGGTTTHLINLINSNKYKSVKFFIITNKNNKGINSILSSCNKKNYKCITLTGRKKNNTLMKLNKSGVNLWVNSHSYNIIETVHMLWLLSIVDKIIGTSIYEPK